MKVSEHMPQYLYGSIYLRDETQDSTVDVLNNQKPLRHISPAPPELNVECLFIEGGLGVLNKIKRPNKEQRLNIEIGGAGGSLMKTLVMMGF